MYNNKTRNVKRAGALWRTLPSAKAAQARSDRRKQQGGPVAARRSRIKRSITRKKTWFKVTRKWVAAPGKWDAAVYTPGMKKQGRPKSWGKPEQIVKKKALWHTAFPAQVDNRAAQRKTSDKRLYRDEASAYVAVAVAAGLTCPVVAAIPELRDGRRYGHRISGKLNEVHHMNGRRGRLLRYQLFWTALSKQGHRWVHQHPKEAREHGWLCAAGLWNKQPPI